MASTTLKSDDITILEIDYTRPSRLDETYRSQKKDARSKRRERINKLLSKHNLPNIPNVDTEIWTLAIGHAQETWAAANIPGWRAHHDHAQPLHITKVARYAKGHAASAGITEGAGRVKKEKELGGAPEEGASRRSSSSQIQNNGSTTGNGEERLGDVDVEDFGNAGYGDDDSGNESVEDPDENELAVIASRRAAKVAARERMFNPNESSEELEKSSRPAKRQRVQDDSDAADDELHLLQGYFTTTTELKRNPPPAGTTVFALVSKRKRARTSRNAVRRSSKNVYHQNDLEELRMPPPTEK